MYSIGATTGAARSPSYRKVIVAPEHMRDRLLQEIEETVEAHRSGEPAWIGMKMNALVDPIKLRLKRSFRLFAPAHAGRTLRLIMRIRRRLQAPRPAE